MATERKASLFPWILMGVFCLLYAFWKHLGIQSPLYAPTEGEWHWSRPEGVILMSWYGRLLGAAVIGFLVSAMLTPLLNRLPARSSQKVPWGAAVLAGLCMIYIAHQEIQHWMLGH